MKNNYNNRNKLSRKEKKISKSNTGRNKNDFC